MNLSAIPYTLLAHSSEAVVENFFHRLQHDWARTGWTVAVLLLVGVLMSLAIPKFLAVLPAIGSAWLTWQIYNRVTAGDDAPLFRGEPDLSQPWDFFWGSGQQFFFTIVGLALAVLVFVLSKYNNQKEQTPAPIRVFAAIGTWFGFVLLYSLFQAFRG